MKKNGLLITTVLLGLLLNGCSNIEPKVENTQNIKKTKILNKSNATESDVAVEVKSVVDKKLEVVTKVKPEVTLFAVEKLQKDEIPVVVVDPVEVDDSVEVKSVDILPVVDDTVGVVTTVKPTLELIEEISVEEEIPAVVIEPVLE